MLEANGNENSQSENQFAEPEKPKSNKRKLKVAFLAIIFLALAGLIANSLYYRWSAERGLKAWVEWEKQTNEQSYADAMADTYGGETPYETLSLYIDAVKKGDYELASKYFREKYRAKELEFLKNVVGDNLEKYIANLGKTLSVISDGGGGYSEDKKEFGTTKPFGTDFVLYPNNIWKIVSL